MPKLYSSLAEWWPLMSAPEEYVEEAEFYLHQLRAAGSEPARTVLELGSGGGSIASHWKPHLAITLVDISAEMLAVSRALNPECEHILGDMRTVRLGRQFDRVFVHDAICYMTGIGDLRQAVETAYMHCRPGGAAILAPDYLRETFRPGTDHGGNDGPTRSMRYLEWVHDPDPSDTTYVADYVYALRSEDGSVRVEHDRHVEGLFARADWLRVLSETGFDAKIIPFEHSEVEEGSMEIFAAMRPKA
ncbi:MAG: class I SAM-dependent methyltransferase [Bryobacteraceae bacterium]